MIKHKEHGDPKIVQSKELGKMMQTIHPSNMTTLHMKIHTTMENLLGNYAVSRSLAIVLMASFAQNVKMISVIGFRFVKI